MDTQILKLKANINIQAFDSSSKSQTYILEYNGKRWQIPENVYKIVQLIDGTKCIKDIHDELVLDSCNNITISDIEMVVSEFLVKKNLLDGCEETICNANNTSSYLWLKIPLIKSSIVSKFKFLSKLYNLKILIVLLIASTFIQLYSLYAVLSKGNIIRLLKPDSPSYLILVMFLLIFKILIHEFGHMTACMNYGLTPGNIGFAFYFISPVLYSDVSAAWSLKRKQRVLVDFGGVYFEFLLMSVICIIGIALNNITLLVIVLVVNLSLLNNFNPFIKLDGYWIISDLLGIPNLHAAMKNYLTSKLYGFWGIKSKTAIDNINSREKRFFEIYTLLSNVFIVFFTFVNIKLFIYTLINLYNNLDLIHLIGSGDIKALLSNISQNLVPFIFSILLGRMAYVTLKSFIKIINDLVRTIRIPAAEVAGK